MSDASSTTPRFLTPPLNEADWPAALAPRMEAIRAAYAVGEVPLEFRMMARCPALVEDAFDGQRTHLKADDGVLDARQREGIALAVSVANGCAGCVKAHRVEARKVGFSEDEVTAILGVTAVCGMLNAYHRHRHMDEGLELPDASGLPHGVLDGSAGGGRLDAVLTELICVVVSGINGCSLCTTAHRRRAEDLGVSEATLHEAVRVGAVMTLFNTYFRIQ